MGIEKSFKLFNLWSAIMVKMDEFFMSTYICNKSVATECVRKVTMLNTSCLLGYSIHLHGNSFLNSVCDAGVV